MKKLFFLRVLSVFFLVVFLSSLFLSVPSQVLALTESYDISHPGFPGETYNHEYTASDLFAELSLDVSETEREYLGAIGALSVKYPKSIPNSYVEFSHNSGVLTVTAKVYTYVAASGSSVSWHPSSVNFSGGTAVYFHQSGEVFVAEMEMPLAEFSEALVLNVEYVNSITVPKDTVNALLSLAFEDGKNYWEANLAYLTELEAYNSALSKYEADSAEYNEALVEYEASFAVYQKYISDKKIYDELYSEYCKYVQDLSEYEEELAEYNAYLLAVEKYRVDYQAYLASEEKKANLADELLAYENYLNTLELINYRLSLVESLKTKVSHLKRNIYDAIMGDTVTAVIENEDIIAGSLVGANREAVQLAGKCTHFLRTLFKDYFSKKTDEDKFIYYKTHYSRFSDNIVNLFRSLDVLYENERVRELLAANEKDEKYRILLAQLYYASLAFSDTEVHNFDEDAVYDENYKIGVYSPAELVASDDYYVDRNMAAPADADVYPAEVAMPDYTPVPEPTVPIEVKKPVAPQAVAEPTKPTEVNEPKRPVQPTAPIAPTAPYSSGSPQEKIAEAYSRGELCDRAGRSSDYAVNLSVNMKKSLGASTVYVVYHDAAGNEVGTVTLDEFAEIGYVPTKQSDQRADYTFAAWVDSDGNPFDLNNVTADISVYSVYPVFEEEIKKYTVTWTVGDSVTTESVPYGEMPAIPESVSLAGNDSVYYNFLGWSRDGSTVCDVAAVTESVLYTAVFESVYTVPTESGGADIFRMDGALVADIKSESYSKVRIDRLLSIADSQLIFRLSRGSVTVSYAEMLAIRENGAHTMEISLSEKPECAEYCVRLYDINGKELEYSAKLSMCVSTSLSGLELRLFTVNSEKKEYFRFNLSEKLASFNLNTGYALRLAKENTVSTFPNELVSFSLSSAAASPGETIQINAAVPDGIRVRGFYYVTSDGVRFNVSGDSFTMPPQSVTVGVDAEIIYYTVSFISNGVIISTQKYRYGETVKIPDQPTKHDDERFSYKFKGWSPEVTPVISDAVYAAEFESAELAPKEPDVGLKISDGVMRIIVTGALLGVLIIGAFIPSSVIAVLLFLKRRRLGICFSCKYGKNVKDFE